MYSTSAQLRSRQNGQTLVELVVVIGVLVIVVGALVFATIASIRNAQFSKNQAQATKLAQEGIERVRTGRDRNQPVSIVSVTNVDSWSGNLPIWDYRISGGCDRSDLDPPGGCYFKVSQTGELIGIGFALTSFPISTAEVPPNNTIFKRAILLSDDDDYQNRKEVSAVVTWIDFSGSHESRLTTILRKR